MRSHGNMTPGILFLFALLFPPLPAYAPETAAADGEPHDFVRLNKPCGLCHASVGVKNRGVMRKTVGEICSECHRLQEAGHPVEMEPAMEVPADLPLDHEGLLTCATCHNVHRSRFDPVTGEKTMYLRRDGSPREFCESCHRYGILPAGGGDGQR